MDYDINQAAAGSNYSDKLQKEFQHCCNLGFSLKTDLLFTFRYTVYLVFTIFILRT